MNHELVMQQVQDRIEAKQKRLEFLRAEWERVDANNPHQSIQISVDIHECVTSLQSLVKFKELIRQDGAK